MNKVLLLTLAIAITIYTLRKCIIEILVVYYAAKLKVHFTLTKEWIWIVLIIFMAACWASYFNY